ncbi:hypothetical protein ILYODFUR_029339 [Ilyodon furcidens]|uniref:Uncharacterized protein n=1 Tax=Ilyodon furcidens TaxID=33524 RepID=A0ABV0TNT0_9TELE
MSLKKIFATLGKHTFESEKYHNLQKRKLCDPSSWLLFPTNHENGSEQSAEHHMLDQLYTDNFVPGAEQHPDQQSNITSTVNPVVGVTGMKPNTFSALDPGTRTFIRTKGQG